VADFCRALAPARVVLVGRSEEALPAVGNVENLLNRTTLAELIWLIRRAAFVVSVDSGPMHIAAALTSHLLSIHTWSDPAKVGPYRPEAWVWKGDSLFQMKDIASPDQHHAVRTISDLAARATSQFNS
jgi:ADP-heptose:LPS heptosyltransferase